jgi:hypothetical protein
MKIPKDKIEHFKGGLLVAGWVALLVWVAASGAHAWAIVGGAGGLLLGVEVYQQRRGNGVAEVMDVVVGAIPSWVVAAVVWWMGW